MQKTPFRKQIAYISDISVPALLLTLFATSVVAAQQSGWSGEGELGIITTTGNTENQSINAKAKGVYVNDPWRHSAFLEAYNNADKLRTTAERYLLSGKSDRKTSDTDYLFGLVTYEDDRFSGYDYRVSEVLGFGRRVIQNPNLTLDLEAGPGARQSKLNEGQLENELMLRLAGDLKWKLNNTAEFSETASTEIGEDVTISKSVTALKARVVGALAMKLAYTIKNTSKVPVETKKTDSETALTLVYAF